jgi:hypothetical protein
MDANLKEGLEERLDEARFRPFVLSTVDGFSVAAC